jgi:hypothetical protein
MPDSLGSTLSAERINSFITRQGKKPQEDEQILAGDHAGIFSE